MEHQKKAELIIKIDQLHRMNYTFNKKKEELEGKEINNALRGGYFPFESIDEEYLGKTYKELMEQHTILKKQVLEKIND